MKRGKKKEENYINKGGKGLKNASFWAINSPRPPQTYLSGEKNESQKRGEGGMIKMHNIYHCKYISHFDNFHMFRTKLEQTLYFLCLIFFAMMWI